MDPSPPTQSSPDKAQLRKQFRALRREHVASLPQSMRALLFLRPPVPVVRAIPEQAVVGLYYPHANEAPTLSYARWLHENGRQVALPRFADRNTPMVFHRWDDPLDESTLESGPFGVPQPDADSVKVSPEVLFMPLIAFTADGARLGQGGGHYDRWLAANPATLPIGLAWDVQLAEALPHEPHDRTLAMVVTPTRLYEGTR
ncbi:5-formyltetrahydrofolate cyclo-ligase [Novosphingobium sp. 9U]|uniref:5-formyltetrahydrofolate cyclo-ligase n=1 Tax=Novosphingobium sp. 9U TaxID=2653158 RepID=UPI0012F1B57D|nr:5-formyltetrahydrofolate cyclo-ligase [Novosphingobium sp. 9U]VWX54673.1 5-formyltetrahydrofolate cyclo-ligase [Novosphingobium sp. 9U]